MVLSIEADVLKYSFFKKDFIYLSLERGREGRRGGEKHQCVVASRVPPTGEPASNPGQCRDWELNWRSSGSQDDTQSTGPHQPGQNILEYKFPRLPCC